MNTPIRLTPEQEETLQELITRIDHLNMAAVTVREAARTERDRAYAEGYMLGELVPFLETDRDETNQELDRYMKHLGLPKRDRGLGKLRPVE